MNIAIAIIIYLALLIRDFYMRRRRLSKKAKVIYIILSFAAIISAIPASAGLDFDTVGSSLSGMISLFMH